MFPSAFPPAVRQDCVSLRVSIRRVGLKNVCMAGVILALCLTAARPLASQVAKFSGAVVTLGGGLSEPFGIAVDSSGDVFFADGGSNTVKEIVAVNGSIPSSPTIKTLGSGFKFPHGVAVDGHGNVYVADYYNNAVKEILAAGGYATIETLGSGFKLPQGIAVDGSGDVFVSDYGNAEVKEIIAVNGSIPSSPTINILGSGFISPKGLAVDGSGDVFVADSGTDTVQEIVAIDGVIPSSPTINRAAAGFSAPWGVVLDAAGHMFVADIGSNAVFYIASPGTFSGPNPVLGSGFSGPAGVALDGSGNVYVADSGNNAVKEIDFAGGNFGAINVGSTGAHPITLDFTFNSLAGAGPIYVVTLGAAGLDFTDAGGDTCLTTGYNTVGTCTVNVNFKPTAPGPRYGSVELVGYGGNDVLATGYVQGTGVGPQAVFATSTAGSLLPAVQSALGSGFSKPTGVSVDGSGDVFVADPGNNAVYEMVAVNGSIPTSPTINTLGENQFSLPSGVALDASGNVFVADYGNNAVKELQMVGNYGLNNNPGSGFSSPRGVAVDGSGNVFVADYSNSAVKEIVAAGGYTTVNSLGSGFYGPYGVAVDANGNVFVADHDANSVEEILAPAYTTVNTLGSGFSGPSGVAVDAGGNVFVADTGNSAVKEILAAGGYTTIVTLGSGFTSPSGVAVDAKGDVFVTDSTTAVVTELAFSTLPSLSFAGTNLNAISSPQKMMVINDGNAPLVFAIPTTGANPSLPSGFVLDSSSTCKQTTPTSSTAFTLAGGASCTLAIEFQPQAPGSASGNVVLTDNSLNVAGVTQSIAVSGMGVGPIATLSPKTGLSFGSVDEGAASGSGSVTLTNTGNAPLLITSIAVTGANASSFVFANTCGASLPIQGSCTIHGHFAPIALGALTAAVTITDNAIGSQQTIALSGTGVKGPVTLSSYSLSFGSLNVGAASASQYVTLTNTGTAALTISSVAVTGTNASSFVFGNNCVTTLAVGATCSIHGHFAPTKGGALTAAITITDNASTSPQTIALSGTGVALPVTLSAANLSFGSVNVGSASGSQSVTVTNTGTAAVTFASIAVTGADASSFVFANTCGVSLAVGAACTIHGHFAPATTGALTAAVTLTDSAATSPQSIALSGTGVAPAGPVTFSTTSLAFPPTTVGTASASQSVTMTNTGTATLTITSIAVTGTDASSFVFANTCGASLTVGASCTIHGHFAPSATGVLTATIAVTDSAAGSPQTIPLSGTGQ